MGSGVDAREGSQRALNMVSSYYKAGFDNVNSLKLVNRLLSVISKDNFSALNVAANDIVIAQFFDDSLVKFVVYVHCAFYFFAQFRQEFAYSHKLCREYSAKCPKYIRRT